MMPRAAAGGGGDAIDDVRGAEKGKARLLSYVGAGRAMATTSPDWPSDPPQRKLALQSPPLGHTIDTAMDSLGKDKD